MEEGKSLLTQTFLFVFWDHFMRLSRTLLNCLSLFKLSVIESSFFFLANKYFNSFLTVAFTKLITVNGQEYHLQLVDTAGQVSVSESRALALPLVGTRTPWDRVCLDIGRLSAVSFQRDLWEIFQIACFSTSEFVLNIVMVAL